MSDPLRIAVATSGGDAPGMNACVRAIVKGSAPDVTVVGVRNGGLGLLRDAPETTEAPADYFDMSAADVASTLHRSGTVLKSARETKFREYVLAQADLQGDLPNDMTRDDHFGKVIGSLAAEALDRHAIDGLILIGGDTTCRAALHIFKAKGGRMPIVVIPATIDNDIAGTKQTIGFDSAVAMAVVQVDALRETAAAMDRIFVVEVMGRDQGHLAVEVALATGAEAALVPEAVLTEAELTALAATLTDRVRRTGSSALVVVAEGASVPHPAGVGSDDLSPAQRFAGFLDRQPDAAEVRVTILGHTLRGAPPTAFTRTLATRSGLRAVDTVTRHARHPERITSPLLIGLHDEGFLEAHEIKGSMVRQERARILNIVADEINRLAY